MFSRSITQKIWFKAIASFLVLLIASSDISAFAASDIKGPYPKNDLNPTLRTSPIVKIFGAAGKNGFSADKKDTSGVLDLFRQDYNFIGVSCLVGQALKIGISEVGLGEFISEHAPGQDLGAFDFQGAKRQGDSFLVSYRMEGEPVPLRVRYILLSEKEKGTYPEALVVGDVSIVIENVQRKSVETGDAGAGTVAADVGGVIEKVSMAPAGSGNDVPLLTEKPEWINEDGSGYSGKAFLDRQTIEKAVLFSLLYLILNFGVTECLVKVGTELLLAIVLSIAAHEASHLFQIVRVKAVRHVHFSPVFDKEGIYFKIATDSKAPVDKIILAGMIASGMISTVTAVIGFYYNCSFLVILSIVNAFFAFSAKDLDQLRRETDFKDAPAKIFKAVRKNLFDIFRNRSKPLIIMMGGYFASGKSVFAHKLRQVLMSRTGEDVYAIGGDNWLLPDDRRAARAEKIYPYNKYEMEKWKDMTNRAAEALPIYIPFYLTTFRNRLTLAGEELERFKGSGEVVRDDGYELINAEGLKERPVRDLLPPEYVREILEKVTRVWKEEPETAARITRRLNLILGRKLKKYLISSKSDVYIDYNTGDLLERLAFKKGDIVIMEFEQALKLREIRELAEVKVFVDASFLHRSEYFKDRRKRGQRYSDMSLHDAEQKFLSLRENEADIVGQKQYSDIVVSNDEYLEEVVMADIERQLDISRNYADRSLKDVPLPQKRKEEDDAAPMPFSKKERVMEYADGTFSAEEGMADAVSPEGNRNGSVLSVAGEDLKGGLDGEEASMMAFHDGPSRSSVGTSARPVASIYVNDNDGDGGRIGITVFEEKKISDPSFVKGNRDEAALVDGGEGLSAAIEDDGETKMIVFSEGSFQDAAPDLTDSAVWEPGETVQMEDARDDVPTLPESVPRKAPERYQESIPIAQNTASLEATGSVQGGTRAGQDGEASGREEKIVKYFLDIVRMKAFAAGEKGERLFIGIDTSWIPEMQRPLMQRVVNAIVRAVKEGKLSNVTLVRENGPELAGEVARVMAVEGGKASPSNVVLLGAQKVLKDPGFDYLREGEGQKGAFFAEVEVPDDFPETGYIGFLEMLTTAVKMAFGGNERIFRFVLKAEPMDFQALKETYDREYDFLVNA